MFADGAKKFVQWELKSTRIQINSIASDVLNAFGTVAHVVLK